MLQFWSTVGLPVFLGSLCISISGILKRYILKDKGASALQFSIMGFGAITLFCGIVYVYRWGFVLPSTLLPGFWTAVLGGTCANFVIQFLNVKCATMDKGEVSLTAPLQAMTPGLITILALLLGEFPGKAGVFGIFLMICGSYVLLWEKTPEHWYDYFGPIRRLRLLLRLKHLSPDERGKTVVVSMALGSAFMGTIGLLFDGLFSRRAGSFQGIMLAIISLVGLLTIGYLIWYLVWPDATSLQRENGFYYLIRSRSFTKPIVFPFILFVVVWSLHWMLIQPAFNHAFVAYVGTLKRFHILITVLLGYFFFKEAEFKKRMWAAALIILGAFFISMDGLPARLSAHLVGKFGL